MPRYDGDWATTSVRWAQLEESSWDLPRGGGGGRLIAFICHFF